MKKESLPRVGFALIMFAFIYLTIKLTIKDVPLNLATWGMWVVIDTSLLFSLILAGNKRPWVMIGFEIGAVAITIIALINLISGNGTWSWGKVESLSLVSVLIALVIWKLTGGKGGVLSITSAMYIAIIPTLLDQWHNPVGQDPYFWGACSLGCLLEFIGKPKTIVDAFMPGCGVLANGLAAILSVRQFMS